MPNLQFINIVSLSGAKKMFNWHFFSPYLTRVAVSLDLARTRSKKTRNLLEVQQFLDNLFYHLFNIYKMDKEKKNKKKNYTNNVAFGFHLKYSIYR